MGRPLQRGRRVVVPARAGVIRAPDGGAAHRWGRPRASGGHPGSAITPGGAAESSPRERGSSLAGRGRLRAHGVVPARAGVILLLSSKEIHHACRPRASGGHPRARYWFDLDAMSSPRERGSSPRHRHPRRRLGVVPARAGVIPSTSGGGCANGCRPRASGGHPRHHPTTPPPHQSSPRERGSSRQRRHWPGHHQVVPARAGVIPTPRR